jgi:hypothetical protein
MRREGMESTGLLVHVFCSREQNNFSFAWPTGRVDPPIEIFGIDSLLQLTWSSLSSKNRLATAVSFHPHIKAKKRMDMQESFILPWL